MFDFLMEVGFFNFWQLEAKNAELPMLLATDRLGKYNWQQNHSGENGDWTTAKKVEMEKLAWVCRRGDKPSQTMGMLDLPSRFP